MSGCTRFNFVSEYTSGLLLVLALLVSTPSLAGNNGIQYEMAVTIDPVMRHLKGRSLIKVEQRGHFDLILSRRFTVTQMRVNGFRITQQQANVGGLQMWQLSMGQNGPYRIEIDWQGELAALNTDIDHAQTLGRSIPASSVEGTFLPNSSLWYPQIAGALASYRVDLRLPHGQRGLVAGKLIAESESELEGYHASFVFNHPAEGIDLMAGPYEVASSVVQSVSSNKTISLRTYFHPRIADLADDYLESVKQYINLYETWIGEYPYSEFSVVSSPTPTGFGMPTLTYLGVDVLRLPFIRATSLGHEVLHNWWGNGVYPDYAKGNWSEGLTTFMADYTYKERESNKVAREMRLDWLRDFNVLVPSQDQPLLTFTSRTHAASKIVGYNKAAIFFFMLRDLLGEETFDQAIRVFWRERRFRITSWHDLQRVFETVSARSLENFFAQWLARTGAPSLQITQATYTKQESGYRLFLELKQSEPAYYLHVPILVRGESGKEKKFFLDFESVQQSYELIFSEPPRDVSLDPDFQLFRQLAAEEITPILREVMVKQTAQALLLFPQDVEQHRIAYQLASRVQGRVPEIIAEISDLDRQPVLVVGMSQPVDDWLAQQNLPGIPAEIQQVSATAYVWTLRRPNGTTLAVVSAKDEASLLALNRALPHYGRQSYVIFKGESVIDKGIWPTRSQALPAKPCTKSCNERLVD
jgi:aminopeptidase N